MQKIDRRTKVMFAVSSAFMLVLFAVASPYASAQTNISSVPKIEQAIGPEDPLYKYLFHVNVTEYPWGQEFYSAGTAFSPSPTAPETNHLLWKVTLARLNEALVNRVPIVTNGLVFVRTDTSKSIYPGVTFALDQNTGKTIWTLPSSVSFTSQFGILWSGTAAYNPDTGTRLYSLTTRPTYYDPELKMAFGTGPTGYNWTDKTKEPVQLYRNTDGASIAAYGNGKIFSVNIGAYNLTAYDAKTGQRLWQVPTLDTHSYAVAKDGKVFCSSSLGQSGSGLYCYDQNTGNLLWKHPSMEINIRGYAYGLVYASTTRTYLEAIDANDGHVVWRYAATRKVPHICGASVGDCNHTIHHSFTNGFAIADGKIYGQTMQKTTYGALLPPNYPGILYEGVRYWVNPNAFPVVAHSGENEFVCLDAWTGKVIWRVGLGWPDGPNTGTLSQPAYAGPDMGFPAIADGKVYGIEFPYSSHTGLGTSRPEVDPLVRYAESIPKFHMSNVWYPGNVYCFGAGPTQLSVHTDFPIVNTGQNVEITVDAQDLSPAHYLAPANDLPVNLRYVSNSGASGDIGTVKTGAFGSAGFTWTVPVAGAVTIIASSPGNNRHEASPDASVTISVGGGITLSTVGSIAGIIAITVSAAAITVPIRKRKQQGGEQLD